MARFYDRNGKRRNRSTRTEDRKEARKLAAAYEDAARRKRTAIQSRRVISSLHKEITGEGLPFATVREFFTRWVETKTSETSPATMRFYSNATKKFLNFLGERADGDVAEVTKEQIQDFRTADANTLSAKTVNHSIKLLRMVFRAAPEDATISDNPVEFVKPVGARGDQKSRRPFTIGELRAATLKIVRRHPQPENLATERTGAGIGQSTRLDPATIQPA